LGFAFVFGFLVVGVLGVESVGSIGVVFVGVVLRMGAWFVLLIFVLVLGCGGFFLGVDFFLVLLWG